MMAAALAAMTLGELLGPSIGTYAGLEVSDLVLDDTQVTAGAAFLAVPGSRTHGLRFAARALERGAAVVLYEPSPDFPDVPPPCVAVPDLKQRLGELAHAFYGRAYGTPELAGVTGTNGKTTVAYVLAQAMRRVGFACGYIGTLGFGVPPDLRTHGLTTPDCLTLHREIAALRTGHVALEVSSHALVQERIAGLAIDTALFTNLTRDHLDAHGDLASYGRAKMRLFTRPEVHNAVLNRDDPFATTVLGAIGPRVRVIGTSLRGMPQADLRARFESRGLDGIALRIEGMHGEAKLHSRFIGRFNAENLLLVLGALVALEITLDDACAALAECRPAKGRMEILGGGDAPHVVVDYAHTPDALERVLTTLREICAGEISCVFGCGGERDRGKRALMGEIAGRHAQHIVLTDDNPRGEDPAAIVADIRAGLAAHPSVAIEHSRDAAIALAIRGARKGDVVLIAGKGHETVQIVGAQRRPFDDSDAATRALRRL
jgi:UDP-N-acetylmuramoyl-L-alanyl-D-glutamate--2,6-diaminopimelate ligase